MTVGSKPSRNEAVTPPRVYVHDSLGPRIGTLTTAHNVNRSWALMQPTQGTVTVDLTDPLITELDPRSGRCVVIDSEAYPEAWVGVVSRVDEDHDQHTATLQLDSLDTVLKDRYLSSVAAYSGTAGVVFAAVITACNSANATGITLASNNAIGPRYAGDFPDRSVYGALNAICAQTGMEWWLDYHVLPSGIVATAHLQPARGFDLFAEVPLVDGGGVECLRSGIDLRNAYYALNIVAGQSDLMQPYTDRPRATTSQTKTTSRPTTVVARPDVHGYLVEASALGNSPITRRDTLVIAESLKSQGAILAAAEMLHGRRRTAERVMQIRVVDPSLWYLCEVGSVVRFTSGRVFLGRGFDGPVRIVGVQPSEESGDLILVTQVLELGAIDG